MEYLHPKYFKWIHILSKFLGIIIILYGIFIIIQNFPSIIGPVPGLASILLGVYLYKSGMEAGRLLRSDRKSKQALEEMLKYGLFLMINGLLFIAAIILYIISICI
ncbi:MULTISPECIES: DUF5362 family protein [Oceanobacillus]|uniref:DUF5362 family protein n=1 Tax=Oceanobacillus TaxID=182709 RepID=UPI0021172422|nr:DUF5362 family protein [Oceanobacillus oncorhynchi]UUI41918.1 DUF5362 family protein [Oceanobacillus oncorhynchi]